MNILNTRNYGDIEKVKEDAKTLQDIINRQGQNFVNDAIAESIGDVVIKFKLSPIEARRILDATISDLKEQILERI